ncbi:hypothetical protein MTO96_002847 [Rhipicephalus appendiculatus]
MADQKPVAKTDMAAVITDNKVRSCESQSTQRGESEFASTANIKTDDNMRMTDDVRGPSPVQNAGPKGQQAPGGGGGGQQPPGGAPMRLLSKENVAAGKATGTSYATDGNYPKTDTAAGISDNPSKLSRTAQEELKRQAEIYARDRLQAPGGASSRRPNRESRSPTSNQAHISERPGFITGTTADRMRNEEMAYARDIRAPVRSGRASVPQGGPMSIPTQGGERVMAATNLHQGGRGVYDVRRTAASRGRLAAWEFSAGY